MEQPAISHDRREETPEAKALWFQSLPLEERMRLLVSFTDLIPEANPDVMERKNAEPIEGRVQVLSAESPAERGRLLALDEQRGE